MTSNDKRDCEIPPLPLRITQPNAKIIKVVDDFVDRFYKRECTVKLEAVRIPVTFRDTDTVASDSLFRMLLSTMENYVITKDKPDENAEWACKLFSLITTAYGANMIDTGDVAKVKKCEEENERLKDIRVKLEAEVLKLKKENGDLHKALDVFGGRSNVSAETEK